MKKLMMILLSFILGGCYSTHFHYRRSSVIDEVTGEILYVHSSKYEDIDICADSIFIKNIDLQYVYTKPLSGISYFRFSVLDSIIHLLDYPKSTIVITPHSAYEYQNKKGLYLVEIPARRIYNRINPAKTFLIYDEIPFLYLSDSCFYINDGGVTSDENTIDLLKSHLVHSNIDSGYCDSVLNRYRLGRIKNRNSWSTHPSRWGITFRPYL